MAIGIPAQKAPYPVMVTAGRKYFWCACGRSARQPFCDGSHAGTGLSPVLFTPADSGQVWFCGCKATRTQPCCDGSHKTV